MLGNGGNNLGGLGGPRRFVFNILMFLIHCILYGWLQLPLPIPQPMHSCFQIQNSKPYITVSCAYGSFALFFSLCRARLQFPLLQSRTQAQRLEDSRRRCVGTAI
ncbi:hypothetical protein QBC41DRAFT_329309 [Cercophora samala]|uniref:Uncharacterized protein n=1 Tax=Cercophora samala TaxID=330535 RepID=A0AA39Z3G5_9PEZI|nr:hypothetical protein QBC41DRAFT_329309 [Cercophora samala]